MSNVVFGRGKTEHPWLMVIGEAPGEEEEKQGKPFVGPSGTLVQKQLERLKLVDDTYVTNVVKVRPPGNMTPRPDEVKDWFPFLHGEITLYHPERIVTLGLVALNALFPMKKSMKANHGRIDHYYVSAFEDYIEVLPLYHPAFVLRGGIDEHSWGIAWNKAA